MSDLVWAAAIAAVAPTLAVFLTGRKVAKKVDEVHALANDRLTKALEKIEALSLVIERQRVAMEKEPP